MYLERFLGVTLDTFHDTSGYMYLGFFIMIHQDAPRYKITIHVSWTRHDDTSGYNQDTSRYKYLGRFVRAALDTHKIRSRYIKDTYLGLVLFALLSKELKALRLFVARVGLHLGLASKGWHQGQWFWHGLKVCESQVLQVNELVELHGTAVLALFISFARPCSCCKVGTPARRNARRIHKRYMWDACGIHAGYIWDTCICSGSRIHGGYMRDICGIHAGYIMRYMYLKCIRRGTYLRCKIHAGYMRDTCIFRGHQDTCGIHRGYMRDTCGIHAG